MPGNRIFIEKKEAKNEKPHIVQLIPKKEELEEDRTASQFSFCPLPPHTSLRKGLWASTSCQTSREVNPNPVKEESINAIPYHACVSRGGVSTCIRERSTDAQ